MAKRKSKAHHPKVMYHPWCNECGYLTDRACSTPKAAQARVNEHMDKSRCAGEQPGSAPAMVLPVLV